jgi:hypothetical protein
VMTGSNRRHPPCKGGALPAELITQSCFSEVHSTFSLGYVKHLVEKSLSFSVACVKTGLKHLLYQQSLVV